MNNRICNTQSVGDLSPTPELSPLGDEVATAGQINDFVNRIINGDTGLKVMMDREFIVPPNGEAVFTAEFTIRCLANPNCVGSESVLNAILQQRNLTLQKIS